MLDLGLWDQILPIRILLYNLKNLCTHLPVLLLLALSINAQAFIPQHQSKTRETGSSDPYWQMNAAETKSGSVSIHWDISLIIPNTIWHNMPRKTDILAEYAAIIFICTAAWENAKEWTLVEEEFCSLFAGNLSYYTTSRHIFCASKEKFYYLVVVNSCFISKIII